MKRRRLMIDLTEEQYQFLLKFPYGWKQRIYTILTEMIIKSVKTSGNSTLLQLMSKHLNLEGLLKEEDDGGI